MNDDAVILQELQGAPEGYREQIVPVIDETGYEVDVAIVHLERTPPPPVNTARSQHGRESDSKAEGA